jgi:hypothetical protein
MVSVKLIPCDKKWAHHCGGRIIQPDTVVVVIYRYIEKTRFANGEALAFRVRQPRQIID